MKDAEFVEFAKQTMDAFGGKLENIPMSLKVDGLGGRFGKSSTGVAFFEGSRTGPITTKNAFSTYAKSNNHDEIRLARAIQYDEIYDILIDSELTQSLPNDTKVVCEIFYNPMGTLEADGIKFVSVKYDPSKLGETMTIVPLDVVYASTGKQHPNASNIIANLLTKSNSKVKVVSPKLKLSHAIDVSAFLKPVSALDVTTLKSLKHADKQSKKVLQEVIEIYKNKLAEFLLHHKDIVGKDILGPEIEGIVINVNGRDIKITTPEFKASKQLKESSSKTIVMAFGRFQPPTTGHGLLVKKVVDTATKENADHVIFASKTTDKKQNPLPVDRKVHYLEMMFPGVNFAAATQDIRTFIEAAKVLNTRYSNLIMVAGSDRVSAFSALLNQYNGKDFNFDSINVISAGERDPDSDSDSGMSGTKMRKAASENNETAFLKGVPNTMQKKDVRLLMKELRSGMGLETSGIKYTNLTRRIK